MFGCSMVKYIFVSQIILTSQKTVHVLHVTLIQNLHNICQLNCNVQHCRNKKLYRYSIIFIKDMIRRSKDIQTRDLHTYYLRPCSIEFSIFYICTGSGHEVGKTEKCAKLNSQHRNS